MIDRSWVIGVAVAVITSVVGVSAVMIVAGSQDAAQGAAVDEASAPRRSTSTSTAARRSTTTTSGAASTTTTTQAASTGPGATLPATGPAPAARPPVDETADPPDQPDPPNPSDRYHEKPFPPGVTATVASCGWSPTNGGELQASGTITNLTADDDFWMLDLVWLVSNQGQLEELDSHAEVYDFVAHQTLPWTLTTPSRIAPAGVSCAIELD